MAAAPSALPLPTSEEIMLFQVHFEAHSEDGLVSAMSAKACLEEASHGALSNDVLAEIWFLCDADGDGQLGQLEFMLAVHLTLHMTKHSLSTLPTVPPELLQHFTSALCTERNVGAALPQQMALADLLVEDGLHFWECPYAGRAQTLDRLHQQGRC